MTRSRRTCPSSTSVLETGAFVLTAKALKGEAWDVAGRIWYDTLLQLTSSSQFADCARLTVQAAGARKYGAAAQKAVKAAWRKVGITV
jgi:Zn-dependent metalloprotease